MRRQAHQFLLFLMEETSQITGGMSGPFGLLGGIAVLAVPLFIFGFLFFFITGLAEIPLIYLLTVTRVAGAWLDLHMHLTPSATYLAAGIHVLAGHLRAWAIEFHVTQSASYLAAHIHVLAGQLRAWVKELHPFGGK